MTTAVIEPTPQAHEPRPETRVDYLNVSFGWKSWLFTTDHKRIALLYLVVITAMFFVGGAFAVLIRLELDTPQADLMGDDTHAAGLTCYRPSPFFCSTYASTLLIILVIPMFRSTMLPFAAGSV